MTRRQKVLLALLIAFCLVLAGLRFHSIIERNRGLIKIVS